MFIAEAAQDGVADSMTCTAAHTEVQRMMARVVPSEVPLQLWNDSEGTVLYEVGRIILVKEAICGIFEN